MTKSHLFFKGLIRNYGNLLNFDDEKREPLKKIINKADGYLSLGISQKNHDTTVSRRKRSKPLLERIEI